MVNFRMDCELKKEMEQLYIELTKFSKLEKNFENYLLFKYYSALLKFILKDYSTAKEYSLEIICDIKDQIEKKNSEKNDVVKYIQIVNSLLSINILEIEDKDKNRAEILDYLESLYEIAKTQKEEMAIKIGLKIYRLQSSNMDYISCIKILDEILKILHKEMLFGRSHKNIVEQYLHVSGLLGYYNVLIGNFKEVKRYSKKINKSIKIIEEANSSGDTTCSKELVLKYDFLKSIMDTIVLKEHEEGEQNEIGDIIDRFSTLNLRESFSDQNHMILNAFILDEKKKYSTLGNSYSKILSNFSNILLNNSKSLSDKEMLGFYFYLYNNMLEMYNKYINGNPAQLGGLLNTLKVSSTNLIQYTSQITLTNNTLKCLFKATYFKELFIRLFYFSMFCSYSEKNYKEALDKYELFNLHKVQFELTNEKGIYSIRKVKADCLFKMNQYQDAINEYSQIVTNVRDKGTVYLNLGICYIFLNDINSAKDSLENAMNIFKNNRAKTDIIANLMNKIK